MKRILIYDSTYGNTAKVAATIAAAVGADAASVADTGQADIKAADLVIVGSPTQAGRPTVKMQDFLKGLPPDALRGKAVAAFDTRINVRESSFGIRLLTKIIGFAAEKMAHTLSAKGGRMILQPAGFCVTGKEGPLAPGELMRAAEWARRAGV